MKTLFILLALSLFPSCRKDDVRNRNVERVDFFASPKDAMAKIQHYAEGFGLNEKVDSILNISYVDSERKSYAFVFYRSDAGAGSLVIEQDYNGNTVLRSKSYKCEGISCTCRVRSIIGDDGHIELECNCTSCTMVIH